MDENCSFSLDHYKYCIDLAKKKGYKFLTLKEYFLRKDEIKDSEKIIVLRHGIDFDLKYAAKVAKVESDLGVKASYYIRVHGKYNPIDLKNYTILKDMQKGDHELGLQYDCEFANMFGEDYMDFLKRDKAVFEGMIGKKVEGVCVAHKPSSADLTDDDLKKIGFVYQAYSEVFFKEMKYISDSSCRWREGCMCNFIKKETPKLCINTHPFWWFNKSSIENWC